MAEAAATSAEMARSKNEFIVGEVSEETVEIRLKSSGFYRSGLTLITKELQVICLLHIRDAEFA